MVKYKIEHWFVILFFFACQSNGVKTWQSMSTFSTTVNRKLRQLV